ncbi:hypothetical protein FRC02_012461 [Tulasnella sp. 418]|nr:hypothetical protein FRC02_012461 [Tulasnella sp. 418]
MLASELPFSSPGLLQRRCEPQDIPKKNADATNFYEKQQKRWLVESSAPDLNSSNSIISPQQSESLPPPHIFQPIPRHATIPSFLADFDHATLWADNQIDLEPASPTSCISSPVLIHDSTWDKIDLIKSPL